VSGCTTLARPSRLGQRQVIHANKCPVTTTQPQTLRCTPQCDVELVSKKEILGLKPALRLEQIDDKRPKQVKESKHRMG
jgi:hypothetical protein